MTYELHEMDCRLAMSMLMDADSIDAIVTDPPYGLSKEPDVEEVLRHWLNGDDYEHGSNGFMGRSWDSFVPGPAVWREAYRVLKPGGHLVAFFGTRTYDLGVMALRMAGFEIRDQLAWVFGSGFPKSHDVSKGIDKAAGAVRTERAGVKAGHENFVGRDNMKSLRESGVLSGEGGYSRPWMTDPEKVEAAHYNYAPATPEAAEWQGWGTALKPAYEPIVLARKPFASTVAANVLQHGTGAINIDGCRVHHVDVAGSRKRHGGGIVGNGTSYEMPDSKNEQPPGRWPANLCLDGSPEVLAEFPVTTSGKMKAGTQRSAQDEPGSVCYGTFGGNATSVDTLGDSGSAARFFKSCQLDDEDIEASRLFYHAKASKSDRNEGLDDLPVGPSAASQFRPNHAEGAANGEDGNPYGRWSPVRNIHPTVKPTDLMRWLVRLITPPGGTVLDPFAGSGSTGKAAILEGFSFVGCEMTPEYAEIARRRIDHAVNSR